jgi:sugar fermentation stimulation protein A
VRNFPIYFGEIMKAKFLKRENRFIVTCSIHNNKTIQAHLPNPGRLWELLLPNSTLFISLCRIRNTTSCAARKTKYTVLAVQKDSSIVFLHTQLTNKVAKYLLEEKLLPPLTAADIVKEEISLGNSRFDFLLNENQQDHYLEVKSCTLFGNDVAMFPDAITERGKKHILELAQMGKNGVKCSILFIVHCLDVKWFMPDFHTDYDFSIALIKSRNYLHIAAVAIGWNPDLTISETIKPLEIPWGHIEKEAKDKGSYLLILRVDKKRRIHIGKLGQLDFNKGYYVYVGSAMNSLSSRIERHVRKRKKVYWHIDYLLNNVEKIIPIPVRSSKRLECEIATALSTIMNQSHPGFGSSDCHCPTHLFYTKDNPLDMKSFHAVLQRFRMGHP